MGYTSRTIKGEYLFPKKFDIVFLNGADINNKEKREKFLKSIKILKFMKVIISLEL